MARNISRAHLVVRGHVDNSFVRETTRPDVLKSILPKTAHSIRNGLAMNRIRICPSKD